MISASTITCGRRMSSASITSESVENASALAWMISEFVGVSAVMRTPSPRSATVPPPSEPPSDAPRRLTRRARDARQVRARGRGPRSAAARPAREARERLGDLFRVGVLQPVHVNASRAFALVVEQLDDPLHLAQHRLVRDHDDRVRALVGNEARLAAAADHRLDAGDALLRLLLLLRGGARAPNAPRAGRGRRGAARLAAEDLGELRGHAPPRPRSGSGSA